jgi:RNA polymerase subunit RPABC4/transcription elongation factor Spt4
VIGIEPIPEPGSEFDVFEASLFLPVPGPEKNSIVFEDRDGSNIQRLTAKGVTLQLGGKRVLRARDVKIDVFVTDARVALACSKYDKGGGWIGGVGAIAANAGSKALASIRRHGKMLVGQARYPWIGHVGSTTKVGWSSDERLVIEAKASNGSPLRLTLLLPKEISGAQVAAEVARRAAAYRLACEHEIAEEARTKFEELLRATPLAVVPGEKTGTIHWHAMPNYWQVNEKSARLAPIPDRKCPHCNERMPRDAETCPHCHNTSTPWQFHEGHWWVRLSEEQPWQWLDEKTNRWRVKATKETKETKSLDPTNRKCPHCNERMPRDAETCPHCHNTSTPWRLHQGRWWVRTSDDAPWQWLDEATGTWAVGKTGGVKEASESP